MAGAFNTAWGVVKTVYCDHCGEPEGKQPFDAVTHMPVDFDSGNAGESAVNRYGGVPPYAETRTYIQRVQSLRHAYRH